MITGRVDIELLKTGTSWCTAALRQYNSFDPCLILSATDTGHSCWFYCITTLRTIPVVRWLQLIICTTRINGYHRVMLPLSTSLCHPAPCQATHLSQKHSFVSPLLLSYRSLPSRMSASAVPPSGTFDSDATVAVPTSIQPLTVVSPDSASPSISPSASSSDSSLSTTSTTASLLPTSSIPPPRSALPRLPFSSGLNVDYVLLAEFDILKGSVVRLQYPQPTGVKEQLLAECMLPEGAHLRESDWTVFFINDRLVRQAEQERLEKEKKEREKAERKAQREREAAAESVAADTTATAANSTHIPASDTGTPAPPIPPATTESVSAESQPADGGGGGSEEDFYCVLNLCRTKYDKGVKRGAMVKSLAIVTRYRFYAALKPVLMLALDAIFDVAPIAASSALSPVAGQAKEDVGGSSEGTAGGEEAVYRLVEEMYRSINAVSFPSSLTTPLTPLQLSLLTAAAVPAPHSIPSSPPLTISFQNTSFPLRLPQHLLPSEVLESSLTSLVSLFNHHIMDIYAALLTQRRIIFLAYQQPASSVSLLVLSSLLLLSPPYPSLLHRAFPYVSLTNMDFLTVPGYVAGVTNPIFESRSQWWDLLCDVSDGTVRMSPSYAEELRSSGSAASDGSLWTEIGYGMGQKYGEEWLRAMFRDYTTYMLSLVNDTAVFPDQPTRTQQLELHQARINAILRSPTYTAYLQQQTDVSETSSDREWQTVQAAVTLHVRTLQHKTVPPAELLALLSDLHTLLFPSTASTVALHHLLALMPESQGGLMPLAMYVLHRDEKVRAAVVRLLQRIDGDVEGRRWMSALNYFVLLSYDRHVRGEKATEKGREAIPTENVSATVSDL